MTDEKDSVKRMLEAKTRQPEYQRLDIEPKIGGQSLLHDEFGIPKVTASNRKNVPMMKEISGDPVSVKASASTPAKTTFRKPGVKKMVVVDDDDKFIPPKNNFVSVGNVEHAWYDDKVTGIIDNNEEVDVEKLQGINPLADLKNPKTAESIKFFTKRLQHVKSLVIAELAEITDLGELNNLRANTFGPKGIFTDIVRQLDTLKVDKVLVGELVSQMYSELDLEIGGKEFELTSEAEEDSEVTEWPEDMAQIVQPTDEDDDEQVQEENEIDPESSDVASTRPAAIPEGHYAIIVDGKLVNIKEDIVAVRDFIGNLLLNDNLDIDKIQLIKRIKIDFGIILGD
jgi:hypothetical protein